MENQIVIADFTSYVKQVIVDESISQGPEGVSAYTTAVTGGFVGTEAEWVVSLKGIQGDIGLQGIQGSTGAQGTQGTKGDTGTQGATGLKGATGNKGLKGDTGTGIQGVRGFQGVTGNTGSTGLQGLQGLQGIDGIGFSGPTGPKGDEGDGGTPGATGSIGLTGDEGQQGVQGIQGLQGIQGPGAGDTPITKPIITSPADGTTNYAGAITAPYATSLTFAGIQDFVRLEMATDTAFTNIVDSYDGATQLSWTPTYPTASTVFYIRVKQGSDNHRSLWSDTLTVTSKAAHIATPTVSVTGAPSNVGKNPVISGSAFVPVFGADTHESTDRIVEDNGVIVWSSYGDTVDLTSITLPFNLSVSTTYTFKIRYKGVNLGYSDYAITTGTTIASFIPIDNYGNAYTIVTSPDTGKDWLGENLSITANSVATAYNDSSSYGSLFQWGRAADGHESRTSATTSTTTSNTSTPGNSNFILAGDWTTGDTTGTIRSANWNPCPTAYRLPTEAEFLAEANGSTNPITNRVTAISNFLKLPSPGYRNYWTTSPVFVGESGYYWTSDFDNSSELYGKVFILYSGSAGASTYAPGFGMSVRCIGV